MGWSVGAPHPCSRVDENRNGLGGVVTGPWRCSEELHLKLTMLVRTRAIFNQHTPSTYKPLTIPVCKFRMCGEEEEEEETARKR